MNAYITATGWPWVILFVVALVIWAIVSWSLCRRSDG